MEKKLTNWTIWREFVADKKLFYFFGALSTALTCLFQVMSPRIVGWTIDFIKGENYPQIFNQGNFNKTLFLFCGLLFASEFLLIILRLGWRLLLARNTHYANAHLRKKIFNHVKFLPTSKLQLDYTIGNLMNISTSDVGAARYLFGFTLVAYIDVIFLTIFCLTFMFLINFEMTLYTLAIFPILPFFFRKLAIEESKRHEKAQRFLSKFNDFCSDAISSIKLQKITSSGKFWEERLIKTADDYRRERLKVIHTSYKFFPLMGLATICSYGILFGFGIYKIFNGNLTIGNFVAYQGALFLLQGPFIEIGMVVSEWQRGKSSLERIRDLLSSQRDGHLYSDGISIRENGPVVRMNHLKIYSPSESGPQKEVIRDLSFSLEKGERLGIMGPIGSGKSILLDIITGLYHNFEGDYYLHGRPISQYGHKELTEFIKLSAQRPFLFADTIRNNIVLNREMKDNEIWELLEVVGIDDEVKKMPYGLNTYLGEWGVNLSGGQKQRISLARSIAKSPKLLLLDDSLSAVDIGTEDLILKNLDQYLKKSTLIWTAHRESTLKYCNEVIKFEGLHGKN